MGNSESSHRNNSRRPQPTGGATARTQPPMVANVSSAASAGAAPNSGANSMSPGAYRMPGQAKNQRFFVTIPRNVAPGQHFAVLVNGQQMMVRCPEENHPGERLIVTAPRAQTQQYVVAVPASVRPGQQFRVPINNQEVMVTCPRGVRPGQRVTFHLPGQTTPDPANDANNNSSTAGQAAPNHQMFEVLVPTGVRPGQPFVLVANNQRVMVTCPASVVPGQKVRFQLPILLSADQLESIKVDYDKDGWIRCLGQDLHFHWVYNKNSNSKEKKQHLIDYDFNGSAFVRSIIRSNDSPPVMSLKVVDAADYSIETTVKGTKVNYSELSSNGALPFQQKVDWLKNQFSELRTPWEEGHIKLKVRRSNMLQDAMDGIESIEVEDMRKIFRFEFIGEPALDAGGVAREFYEIVSEQLFNPDFGLFSYSSINQMCMQINSNSGIANEYHLRYFHVCGRILGKSLMDSHITPVHLVQPLYKHLMGWPITLHDLEHIDDQIYRQMINLLNFEDIACLDLEFVATEDFLGKPENVELVPGGSTLAVTSDNLTTYLDAQVRYRTTMRVLAQLTEFLKGFYDVVPEPLLSVFDFQELELLLHGLPHIDMDDWVENTIYSGDFAGSQNQRVTKWFWEVLREMEHEQKAKLLQFVTGTSGVPVQGFMALQGNDGSIRKFTLHGDKNLEIFPRAHTCFNRMDVPLYSCKADLKKYLTMAISMESTGFGIE